MLGTRVSRRWPVAVAARPPRSPSRPSRTRRATTPATTRTRWQGHEPDRRAGLVGRRLHGRGVDVALIDSAWRRSRDSTARQVVYGPDLSLESQSPDLTNLDTYGHGTFMAGLIAGNDGASPTRRRYRGIAPDARIVSLKVAHRRRRHRRQPGDRGDRLGRPAQERQRPEHPRAQPLVRHELDAVVPRSTRSPSPPSRRGRTGIVVVAAAGNTGYQRGNGAPGLANPAYNPFVIGVGGYDTKGTAELARRRVGTYSASSTGCGGAEEPGLRRPRLPPPGPPRPRLVHRREPSRGPARRPLLPRLRHLAGGRDHERRGRADPPAVPELTPDQVKRFITDNARKLTGSGKHAQGDGGLRARREEAMPRLSGPTQRFEPRRAPALELSRGDGSPDPRRRRPRPASTTSSASPSTPRDRRRPRRAEARGRAAPGTAAPGRAAAGGQLVVGEQLVRQHLVRQLLVGKLLVRQLVRQQLVGQLAGPAAAGPAAPGRAAAGPAAPGRATGLGAQVTR